MGEIKVYEKMFRVVFSNQEFYLDEKSFNAFKGEMKKPGIIIDIGGQIFNKSMFRETEEIKADNDLDKYILQQPGYIRKRLREREKEKKEKVGRGFESIGEIQRYIETYLTN